MISEESHESPGSKNFRSSESTLSRSLIERDFRDSLISWRLTGVYSFKNNFFEIEEFHIGMFVK